MIQNIVFVYFSICTYSQGMRAQVLTYWMEWKALFEPGREDK